MKVQQVDWSRLMVIFAQSFFNFEQSLSFVASKIDAHIPVPSCDLVQWRWNKAEMEDNNLRIVRSVPCPPVGMPRWK